MDSLPDVALSAALDFCDRSTLLAAESTSRHQHHIVHAQGLWENLARRAVVLRSEDAPTSVLQWKRLVHVAARPTDSLSSLLNSVTDCSSVDRPEESPDNTLTPSPCWLSMESLPDSLTSSQQGRAFLVARLAAYAQIDCGCEDGEACYWSSTPSPDPTTQDFIDYTVQPKSLVRQLQVTPYRAYWHPEAPAYGPRAVSCKFFSICNTASSERELLYESPVFPLENKMQLNEFVLSHPLWLPNGGVMRLILHGRHQAETMAWMGAEGNTPQYYSCVSYVGASGEASVYLQPVQQHRDAEQ